MPQSLARLYTHLIFSTRNRIRMIPESPHDHLHDYMGGILRDLDSPCLEVNVQPDHAHLIFLLSRKHSIADLVCELKRGSTLWLRRQSTRYRHFHWQKGYGAFSVSQSGVDAVRAYIRNQKEHHRRMTFQDEFRAFLKKNEIDYDERYVWD